MDEAAIRCHCQIHKSVKNFTLNPKLGQKYFQNPPIRWPIHLPPYGRFECKQSKKESQLGRGKPVWYILEKNVWAGLNVDFFNQEQIKQVVMAGLELRTLRLQD